MVEVLQLSAEFKGGFMKLPEFFRSAARVAIGVPCAVAAYSFLAFDVIKNVFFLGLFVFFVWRTVTIASFFLGLMF